MRSVEFSRLINSATQQFIDVLRRAAGEGLGAVELTDVLKTAFIEANRIDSAVHGAIAALKQATDSDPDGLDTMGLDCATWLSHTLNISSSAAHAKLHLARQLPSLPATAAAFERGQLSAQHAGVVGRVVESVTRAGGHPGLAESLMLEQVQGHDPRGLLRWGLGLVHRLAPREMEAEEEQRHRRRYLNLSERFDGGYEVEGYLDPIGGATLKTALQGLLGPRAKDDERTPGQRRADGVVELAMRVMDSGELPVRGGQRPHLTITATLETLRADPGAPAALMDWGFPISGKALRRIASDAELTPILLSAGGDPLHVGRRYRTATPKMRKALAERDRRCAWPACPDPPGWCQGHHETEWVAGGRTDIDVMSLVCGKHHPKLSRGWRLERLPGGGMVARPPSGRYPLRQ